MGLSLSSLLGDFGEQLSRASLTTANLWKDMNEGIYHPFECLFEVPFSPVLLGLYFFTRSHEQGCLVLDVVSNGVVGSEHCCHS